MLHVAKWGSVGHEIGHALGLIHEHQRPDRTMHVIILANNIEESLTSDFDSIPTSFITTYGIPYDLGSIMHYHINVGRFNYFHNKYYTERVNRAISIVLVVIKSRVKHLCVQLIHFALGHKELKLYTKI
jgi:hypothetical protein